MTPKQRLEEIKKAIKKIEVVQEEIVMRGLDDNTANHWGRELQGPIYNIRKALEDD